MGQWIQDPLTMPFATVSGTHVEKNNFNCFGGEHCCVD